MNPIAIVHIAITGYVIYALGREIQKKNKEIDNLRNRLIQTNTIADLHRRLNISLYESAPEAVKDVPEDLVVDIDAYLIFKENNML